MNKLLAILGIFISALSPKPIEVWAEPIPYFQTEQLNPYLAPVTKYGAGHRGVDFLILLGDQVSSPQAGEVHFVGKVVDRDIITIKTDEGYLATFEPVCSELTKGSAVQVGEVIGSHCQADSDYKNHCESCVHFSARSPFGYISPLYLMGKTNAAILTA
ncbi:peptidoglycan DD-metalloendopeptidase family protein [Candidatus Aquiluna sp. UB-MaderosW2red]|uniref:peptidoglycan DD-metalloendopeptidase family protein n=1 Tax=Candidatus Aquiluna sp. UB-MaderosW2red TaxID=1855377 RepID=UPI000875AEB5|nr:peptidoglycan DD-metalloendopeptidase family protein [Candidatus Aquiluna sp. UB-MaderosW2red]SCX09581.1 Peptidase family M23 [Candidatus Aquiluna sp. UB-MaderosW2red]